MRSHNRSEIVGLEPAAAPAGTRVPAQQIGRELRKLLYNLHQIIRAMPLSGLEAGEEDRLLAMAARVCAPLAGVGPGADPDELAAFAGRMAREIGDRTRRDEALAILGPLSDWADRLADAVLITRDLANRCYLRTRIKDREQVADYLGAHPLARRFDDMEPAGRIGAVVAARREKFYNSRLLFKEILLGNPMPTARPMRLTIEPTSMCNFRCVMCPQGIDALRPGFVELSDTQVELLLPVLPALENLAVQVIGEPTASLQLGKLANFATAHAVEVDMITNGSLLHRTNADLSRFGSITISFDGATRETFETQRAGARFDQVVANIRATRALAPQVRMEFNVCLTHLNLPELEDIVRLAADIGIDLVRVSPLQVMRSTTTEARAIGTLEDIAIRAGDNALLDATLARAREVARELGLNLVVTIYEDVLVPGPPAGKSRAAMLAGLRQSDRRNRAAEMPDLVQRLLECDLRPPPELLHYLSRAPAAQAARRSETDPGSLPAGRPNAPEAADAGAARALARARAMQPKVRLPYCTAPWIGGLIFSTGDYVPCCYLAGAEFGSVTERPFEDLWNGDRLIAFREEMQTQDKIDPVCEGCNALQRYQQLPRLLQAAASAGYAWDDIEFPRNFDPPPQYIAAFDRLRAAHFPKRDRRYVPGEEIRLSDPASQAYLGEGFTPPAPAGRWTDGFEAELRLEFETPPTSDLWFEMVARPFVDADLHPAQRFGLMVGDDLCGEHLFDTAAGGLVRIRIPRILAGERREMALRLRLPDAATPRDLGKSRATASRALLISSITLRVAGG